MSTATTEKKGGIWAFLDGLERLGNMLPSPMSIFAILWLVTAICSVIWAGSSVINPATQKEVVSLSLFSQTGLVWVAQNLLKNFTGYAPLGLVVVMSMGIGLADEVGMLNHMIKAAIKYIPGPLIPYGAVALGTMAQLASDSAQIVYPPLMAAAYYTLGRHPVCGCLTAWAGTSLGYLGNPIITGTDVTAQGITNSAMVNLFPGYQVDALCNWYFKLVSWVFLSIGMGAVSAFVIEPRFGTYVKKGRAATGVFETEGESTEQDVANSKGATYALIVFVLYAALLVFGYVMGPLQKGGKVGGGFLGSVFLSGIVPFIWGLFMTTGLAFGIGAGTIKSEMDVYKMINRKNSSLGSYLTMAFVAGQFSALFNWTQLGTVLSVNGAKFLSETGFTGFPLMVCFALFIAIMDFLMSSASAKWVITAPVFVPMFAYLGYHPAFTQVVYRVGDSAANIMSPTSAMLWMLLDLCQRDYDPDIGIGTFLSNQFVFFVFTQVGWWIIMYIWMVLDLPVGPGISVKLSPELAALATL